MRKSIKEIDIANKFAPTSWPSPKEKRKTGVAPQTVANYLSHLSAVFTVTGPAWNDPLDERAVPQ